jgi:hypothetical protein
MSALTRTVDARDDRSGQRGLLFSTPFVLRRASGNYRAGLEVLIGDDQKSGVRFGSGKPGQRTP